MKVFRNLLLVFVVLTCFSACSDADDDISINDVNNVIEDEFSGYRELIGIWEGGWYDLGMKLSADKKCRMYRGEPSWSGEGTWEYNADSKILTTTCGYTLTIERLNSGELWCRDQYGELYMLRRRSSILNPDELPSWWDFDINRRVIVGTWKNGTKAVTLKFYKDGQFLLSNGFASYVGNFFFGDEITGDCHINCVMTKKA